MKKNKNQYKLKFKKNQILNQMKNHSLIYKYIKEKCDNYIYNYKIKNEYKI